MGAPFEARSQGKESDPCKSDEQESEYLPDEAENISDSDDSEEHELSESDGNADENDTDLDVICASLWIYFKD